MKLKVLPPTLRVKKRYLFIEAFSQEPIDKKNLMYLIWDGCIRYHGESHASNFDLWIVEILEESQIEEKNYIKFVLKCQRGYEEDIRAAIALITKYQKQAIVFRTLGLSGTIKAGTNNFK